MKFWDILSTANSNLRRNKTRTILTIVAIFVGAFTISLTLALRTGVNDYIQRQLGSIGGDNTMLVMPKSDQEFGSGPQKYDPNSTRSTSGSGFSASALSSKDLDKIRAIDGVNTVEPQRMSNVDFVQGPNGEKYQISTITLIDGIDVDLAAGSAVDQNSSENQINISLEYVSILGFGSPEEAVGKTVQLSVTAATGEQQIFDAKVAGVQNQALVGGGASNVNAALATNMYNFQTTGLPENMKDQYMLAVATFDDGLTQAQKDATKQAIVDAGYMAQTVQDQIGLITSVIDAITITLTGFGAIALFAASFGIINTLFMAVQERTKEIGLMKAMGMRSRKIFLLFSTEAILLGFWGSLIGVLVAVGAGQAINAVASDTFLKDLSGFTLMEFPIVNIALIMLVIMLIAFLAGTLPARRAAKQNPIDALRYE